MIFNIIFKAIGINSLAKGTKQVDKNLENSVDHASELDKTLKKTNKTIKSTGQGFAGISDETAALSGMFDDVKHRIVSMKDFMGGIGTSMSALTARAGALAAAFLPATVVLAAIVAGVLILRRAFQINAGGMATTWNRIMGKVKKLWSQFVIAFDKSLRKLGPIFSYLGKLTEGYFELFAGIFRGLGAIISPIIDAFGELFEAIGIEGGNANDELEMMVTVGKTIGTVFEYVGKTIGFVIKLAVNGFKSVIGILKTLGQILTGDIGGAFETIKGMILDTLDLIPDWLLPDSIKAVKQTLSEESKKASGPSGGNTTQDNRSTSMVIHTSREINGQGAQGFLDVAANQMNL